MQFFREPPVGRRETLKMKWLVALASRNSAAMNLVRSPYSPDALGLAPPF
jgi:hypothetical protein